MPPKFCPECGEEYVHSATICLHCDVELALEPPAPGGAEGEDLPPTSELVCVRASSVGWAVSLSERLVEAGIPHRIEAAQVEEDEGGERRPGHNLPYGVFVLPDDLEEAEEIDAEHTEHQIPDMPEDYDPTAESEACPACGAPVDESATECADCGLALLVVE